MADSMGADVTAINWAINSNKKNTLTSTTLPTPPIVSEPIVVPTPLPQIDTYDELSDDKLSNDELGSGSGLSLLCG